MKSILYMSVAIILIALLLYFPVLGSNVVFFSTDNNIGAEAVFRNVLEGGFGAFWGDTSLLGGAGMYWPNWTGLLLTSLPLVVYVNWVHAIDLSLASLFLFLFLRQKGVFLHSVSLVAILVAFWVGVNFCLAYSGHNNKFATLMLATASLLGIYESVRRQSVAWAIVAGGVLGVALVEQQDVALFFGIFLGGYAIFSSVRRQGWKLRAMARVLAPMGIMILVVAGSPALNAYRSQAIDSTSSESESGNEKWNFITQWSQPPDETIELLAPGYMGWRSGEPEGPYWGRCGRSAEWEKTRQGFMNFRLDSLYIGAIPIVFALFAFVAAVFAKRKTMTPDEFGAGWEERRAEILFWAAVAVITLLLAYGKFTPLYWLFYQLPVVNNIRAPVKFLQVFQVALAILAAYGLDFAVQWFNREKRAVRQ